MKPKSRLLLIVNQRDIETPLERLRLEVFAKLAGYLREEASAAERLGDARCPTGYGFLIHNPHYDVMMWEELAAKYELERMKTKVP